MSYSWRFVLLPPREPNNARMKKKKKPKPHPATQTNGNAGVPRAPTQHVATGLGVLIVTTDIKARKPEEGKATPRCLPLRKSNLYSFPMNE